MILTIASGKGGTGKTTVAVNLAFSLAQRGTPVQLLDCDVEEPNDHLFVKPTFGTDAPVSVPKPVWDEDACTACGRCAEACRYNALAVVKEKVLVFNELCHACGVCSYVCPENALSETPVEIGRVQLSEGPQPFAFGHGLLNVGEALAPSVVRAVKSHIDPSAVTIIDAAPGTACPVVEAVDGSEAVWLVTEPTPFGLNDLKLALALALKAGVPTGIIVNRSDGTDSIIADYAETVGVPIVGRIPFNRRYAEAYSRGDILAQEFPEVRERLLQMFDEMNVSRAGVPAEDLLTVTETSQQPFEAGDSSDYREITVISGKGGTGKTTLVGSLARLAGNKVLADNDVDAADLHLLLAPSVKEAHDFVGGLKATVDADACVGCGKCADACHFDAVKLDGRGNDVIGQTYRIDPLACEGCGLCPLVCPVDAISSQDAVTGRWFISATTDGPMAHARLGIAEENSGRLVTKVRDQAARLASDLRKSLILGDGPPGTGCPVIASVSGTDLVVIVTEPTVSGVHDMERVLGLCSHFGVPAGVVINKADLNREQSDRIAILARTYGTRVIGTIPFDADVNDALLQGKTVVDCSDGPASTEIKRIWNVLSEELTAMRRQ